MSGPLWKEFSGFVAHHAEGGYPFTVVSSERPRLSAFRVSDTSVHKNFEEIQAEKVVRAETGSMLMWPRNSEALEHADLSDGVLIPFSSSPAPNKPAAR